MPSLPSVDYADRRRRVMESIGENAALILFSNPEQRRSNDTFFPYRQNSDLLYLCGFEEPESVLVLLPGAAEPFVLFVRPRDRSKEVWTGYRAGPEGAMAEYGADAAFTIDTLDDLMPSLVSERRTVYHVLGESPAQDARVMRWIHSLAAGKAHGDRSADAVADPRKILHRMRMVKDDAEIARMRRAAEISADAHLHLMRTVRPGQPEYALDGLLFEQFRRAGASAHAYDPIVAGGRNACVLHYVENRSVLKDGDLVLIDAGAEWQHYAGDITRTWPIGARFDGPQRAIYDAVLDAQVMAVEATVAGTSSFVVHQATVRRLIANMIDIGLLKGSVDEALETQSYLEYYMHGTGHYLGMDVHDVGAYRDEDDTPVIYQPGMVVTVEPGIYVRADSDAPEAFHGIGVRIEDDVLIGAPNQGPPGPQDARILTRGVPKDPETILALRRDALSDHLS